jgi:hypothetical protein
LGEQAGRLRSTANDTYQQASEKVSQIVDRGKEAYERARGSMGTPGPGDTGYPSGTTGSTGGYGSTSGSTTGTTGGYTSAGTTNRL